MMRHRRHMISVGVACGCFAALVGVAGALTMNNADDPGLQNPGLDVTRHAMPPPEITAKPVPETPGASPRPTAEPQKAIAPSANPLWAIPLSALSATRIRPLFTPSRRPPAPVVANVPRPAPRPAPPPPPPPIPEHPNLTLVGTVAGENEAVAVFIEQGSRDTVRLRTGEGHSGWILQSVDRGAATLQKGVQTETLVLPKPGSAQAAAPVISPLPPPPSPPPQSSPPPESAQPAAKTPAKPPQPQGCLPPPIGC
jgi:general secretion pathway protein N